MLQEIAIYKSSLASCAIENNQLAQMHLDNCRDMKLIEKYNYLKNVFDDIKKGEVNSD